MKFVRSIHDIPKKLFRSKKSGDRHISKSEPASFNTVSSSSSSSSDASDADNCKARRSSNRPGKSHSQDQITLGDDDIWFELVEAFKLIDRDGDGKIPKFELENVLSRIGRAPPNDEELTTMLAEIDRDGDGCITLEEFGAIRSAFGPASGTEELRETFEIFDTDNDGRITAGELHRVFSAIGDDQCTLDDCKRMIASVDGNGEGFVCFEDFRKMMEPQQLRCV